MPISDLLASITGEKPTTSPTTSTRPSPGIPKRKADDELRGATVKAPRTESQANGTARPNGNSSRPNDRPSNPASSASSASVIRQPSSTVRTSGAAPPKPVARTSSTSSSKPLPTRPLVNRPLATDGAAKSEPPKKRSFAEIMARAKANTAVRESVGKIQHKAVEKTLTMKERKELKADEARQLKKGARQQSLSRNGATTTTSRLGAGSASQRGLPSKSAPLKGKQASASAPAGEEKKVKKAALATTGYTGTARPPPGAKSSRPGAGAATEKERAGRGPRYGGALAPPRRHDDYDDELDDFIEYDDEEEEYGSRPGPRYDDEEDESDMEAGLSDIDDEERRAELVARQEDMKEELLEQQRRREKERRKLAAARGSGR